MPDLTLAAAEIFLTTAICVILLVDAFLEQRHRMMTFRLAILALIGAALCSAFIVPEGSITILNEAFIADPAGNILKLFSYLVVALVFLYSRDYLVRAGLFKGEFFILGLFGLLGVMVMISANNLLLLYLGLELLSLSLYALVAFDRESGVAAESAMKYTQAPPGPPRRRANALLRVFEPISHSGTTSELHWSA